jgi:hypothetical protein
MIRAAFRAAGRRDSHRAPLIASRTAKPSTAASASGTSDPWGGDAAFGRVVKVAAAGTRSRRRPAARVLGRRTTACETCFRRACVDSWGARGPTGSRAGFVATCGAGRRLVVVRTGASTRAGRGASLRCCGGCARTAGWTGGAAPPSGAGGGTTAGGAGSPPCTGSGGGGGGAGTPPGSGGGAGGAPGGRGGMNESGST